MDLISATHELANTLINIFPNPAVDIINVIAESELQFDLKLFSLDGKLLISSSNESFLDISSLITGTYLLQIEDVDSGQRVVEQIVIAR